MVTKGEIYNMTKEELLQNLKDEYKKISKSAGQGKVSKVERSKWIKEKLIEMSTQDENIARKGIGENLTSIDFEDRFIKSKIKQSIKGLKTELKTNNLRYANKFICDDNFHKYINEINLSPNTFVSNIEIGTRKVHHRLILTEIDRIKQIILDELSNRNCGFSFYISDTGEVIEYNYDLKDLLISIEKELVSYFTTDVLLNVLKSNPTYTNAVINMAKQKLILDEIPENFIDLYPRARLLNRKWKLHIGPTNSGKTYESLERLKEVESGLYLAPLRLLALEVQEKMLESNVLCDLTTGEEEDLIEGATHCSATVEKLNIDIHYDVCVIDEAQMIADRDRGWAWTRAILGVYASEVHVCMSEDAKEIVCKLIEQCGEEFEIIEHHRNTELIFEEQIFKYPEGVRKNDALVVFSRKAVLAVASELENKGHKVSILYGNLPYQVRKEELRKFRDGETDMIVTTDCIGMGMNVNVERIVFLSSSKFDGQNKRFLNISEVKQIAGRAGRMGMFEKGYVNALEDRKGIERRLNGVYESIDRARFGFPETLININETLSDTFIIWSKIPDPELFVKTDIQRSLLLCRYVERFDFDKVQMLKFINIPFDDRNDELLRIWQQLIASYSKDKIVVDSVLQFVGTSNDLSSLELDYKKLDLLFSFLKSIDTQNEEYFKRVTELKEEISMKLIKELKKKKNIFKHCNVCGKKLPWNYEYGMCQKCFEKQRRWYYDEYYL